MNYALIFLISIVVTVAMDCLWNRYHYDGILYIEEAEDGHERWIFEFDPSQVDHAKNVTLRVITRKGVDHSES